MCGNDSSDDRCVLRVQYGVLSRILDRPLRMNEVVYYVHVE